MAALATVAAAEPVDLPTLVDRAAHALTEARNSAEVLEARDLAALAYDAAKRAARLHRAKDAHDTLIAAAHRAQAHALEIEAAAKRRLCDHHALCHGDGAAAVTCRTCLHATPVEGGWSCARWSTPLDPAAQKRACAKHLFVPALVPGDVEDAGDDHVVYRLRDGARWVNDAREAAAC